MSLAERENYQMQQAMSQSITENQPASQENGVTAGNSPHFGPATREHYDTQKWTMTLPRSFAQEVLENPDPSDRMRGESPAFLRPSLAGHRLPALIKILQAIPVGREALLNAGYTLPDYGHNTEWWDGVPIDRKTLRIIDGLEESKSADPDEILYETQRLIAFLEDTERAYGNSEALAQISILKNRPEDLMASQFLEAWTLATIESNPKNPFAKVFQTASITMDSEDREVESHLHHFFDISIADAESDAGRNLYDIMDGQFWGDYLENNAGYHCLKEVGDILCIQISCQKEEAVGTGVKIPAILYLDRYFACMKSQVQRMLAEKRSVKKEIKIMDDARDKIIKYKLPTEDSLLDAPGLIARALQHFQKSVMLSSSETEKTLEELKVLAKSVAIKLATLQKSKNSALEKLKEMSRWYTTASDDVGGAPHHKRSSGCIEPGKWQWWKLTYSIGDAKPVSRTEAREVEVLKAAKDDSRLALLVYANEKALDAEPTQLPSQLRDFVRADNLDFSAELDKHDLLKPAAPTKRKVGDRYDNQDDFYHSSEDGMAVDISLDDPSEQLPLIERSGSQSSQRSNEGTTQSDQHPFGEDASFVEANSLPCSDIVSSSI
ncbi:MAG: hypothetical protein Q9195_002619 [Heterodermia aff. obscurata]